ncbi:MAG: redoxin family protein [Sulfurimonadaceae bacterium]|jgi:thiol-disulfide isomerase/thioredoxin|nr:redoxin family protein [Sulfurimonadaceae bacterium]
MKKYLKELLFIVVALFLISNAISYTRSQDLNQQSLNIDTLTLIDGTTYTIKNDRPTIVYFWATWCPICKLTSSNIDFLAKYLNVLSIAVSSKNDEDIAEYMDSKELSFLVYNDRDGNLANSSNIKVFPTIMIYDKNGKLYSSDVGYSSTFMLMIKYILASY